MIIKLLFTLALAQEIRVMVVDTGVSTKVSEIRGFLAKENEERDLTDEHNHGTHITGLITLGVSLKNPVCKQVKIYSCKVFEGKNLRTTAECFKKAKDLKIDVINFSGGGSEYLAEEHAALKALPKSTKIIVASGNFSKDMKKYPYYPASLKLDNMEVVGNGDNEKDRHPTSNYGLSGMLWINGTRVKSFDKDGDYVTMTGSSQSTALRTNEVLRIMCRRFSK